MRADIVLGVTTVLMAAVGFALSLHAPEERPWKITYAALFIGLGLVSIIYVIRQSNEGATANIKLTSAVAELEGSTKKIADMTTLNTQLQEKLVKQSDTITDLSRENIAAVTGGNSYCYVIASPVGDDFLLNVSTKGSSPLHEVFVDMVDVDILRAASAAKQPFTWEVIQSFTTSYPAIPFLASSSGRMLSKIPAGRSDKRNLHFNFFSMNGVWGEELSLRLIKGQWLQAIKVTKELKGNRRKVVYSYVPDGYPRIDGKVDW